MMLVLVCVADYEAVSHVTVYYREVGITQGGEAIPRTNIQASRTSCAYHGQ